MVDRRQQPSGRRSTALLSIGALVALVALYLAIDPFGDDEPNLSQILARGGCTEIGCESGVYVLAKKVPAAARTITLCKNEKCKTEEAKGHQAGVSMRCNSRPATFRVSVVLRDGRGAVLSRSAAQVTLERHQPNGPGCPPTCWAASLEYAVNTDQLLQQRLLS